MKIRLVRRKMFDISEMTQEFIDKNPHRKVSETIAYREGMNHIIEMIFGKA